MSSEKKDPDTIFGQPFPPLLALLETDPGAALKLFASHARPWLVSHPTPGMRHLTASELQEVVDETIARCVRNNGEALRNYTDFWGTFGDWLSGVAESTCSAGPRAISSAPGTAETTQTDGNGAVPREPISAETGVREAPAAPGRKSIGGVHTVFVWIRSPFVYVPILILAAIVIIRLARPVSRNTGGAKSGDLSATAVVMGEDDISESPYDILPIPPLPVDGESSTPAPVTIIFRTSRLVVLRLELAGDNPAFVNIRNSEGELVWTAPLEDETARAGRLFLQIDADTFLPGDYALVVSAVDSTVSTRSVFSIR